MDKNAIKKYAVWARNELIERVSQKALQYGVTADDKADPKETSVNGKLLSETEIKQREALIRKVNEQGYEQTMEEVAYTWFNRFAALRFMEVNGYLPSHVRVFTNDAGEFKPQILSEAIHLEIDGINRDKVYELKNANKNEELFKYLLITQCNALSSILPGMFQKIEDYTELLLPDYLLREGSAIEQMVVTIPEEDWTDQVQIIGWLYQYYNSEPKDQVFADLKKNKKITKEKIPAATQLFTPDWIVRYMVENSLGRLWLEGHPQNKDKFLPTDTEQKTFIATHAEDGKWHYYLEEAEQEPEVQKQLDEIHREYSALKPEEIRCIDPCMGSGHIICYLFDTLVKVYEDYGYTAREAASLIVENNLWGLDIDDRAAQLAYFSVMMKARQYDRRFFSRGLQPHVYAIVESNHLDPHCVENFVDGRKALKSAMDSIISDMHDAKEYGSIIDVSPVDFDLLYNRFDEISHIDTPNMYDFQAIDVLFPLIQVAQALSQKYWISVTNPPYMGLSNASAKLNEYVLANYSDSKADLFAIFIEKCKQFSCRNGFFTMITMHSWMFLSSFEKLRKALVGSSQLVNMVHLGMRAFNNDVGTIVQTVSFTFTKTNLSSYKFSVVDVTNSSLPFEKETTFLHSRRRTKRTTYSLFERLPNTIFAYWATDNVAKAFSNKEKIESVSETRIGMATANNDRFMRLWHEIDISKAKFNATSRETAKHSGKRWFPYCKGGTYRKWYGNKEHFVNWENDGFEIQNFRDEKTGRVRSHNYNLDYIFKPGFTFTAISNDFSCRTMENALFGSGGSGICAVDEENYYGLLGLLNSKIILYFMRILSQTMNFEVNQVGSIPFFKELRKSEINTIVMECVELSRKDWDSFENSWDFRAHPFITSTYRAAQNGESITVEQAFEEWRDISEGRFSTLKKNEEELNRILIDIYGLNDELTPEVEDKDVTVRKADLQRDIRSLLSFAVGCMFGRYSLDVPGLAYAGGEWDASKHTTFQPDKDAIIPICDDEYFEDDIVGRFVKFIEVVYGKETLEENLRFIADALGGKGSSREVIRNYFTNDFYADHLKVYQKRPIYWLFDSGKKNGFKCLIYMHRYQPDTIARIRTDYVHEQQSRYRTAITDLQNRINGASTSELVKLNKQLSKVQAQADELRVYEEKIHHLADQMIKIDLDDGVKHNYEIFKDVLAKIK